MKRTRRLYRSRQDRQIAGVCGGLAAYFDIDPSLIRVAWILLTMTIGSGVMLYIILMIVIPEEPFTEEEVHEHEKRKNDEELV